MPEDLQDAAKLVTNLLHQLTNDVTKVQDNLLEAKISQAHHAKVSHGPDPHYEVNDLIMLSTTNRHHEYKRKGEKQTAKFFPRWDSPYCITHVHPEASTYTLDIPTNAYPVYHASELKTHHANDPFLFPSCELVQLAPILTADSLEECTSLWPWLEIPGSMAWIWSSA